MQILIPFSSFQHFIQKNELEFIYFVFCIFPIGYMDSVSEFLWILFYLIPFSKCGKLHLFSQNEQQHSWFK